MQAGHAWYLGHVGHQRYLPKSHGFGYSANFFWLDLSQLATLEQYSPLLKHEKFGAFSFRRRDYLAGDVDLQQAVLQKVGVLGGDIQDIDQVFMLSPLANWGLYFSPLTLYYCFSHGKLQVLLAEVSNTPWNERHYYLVPIAATPSVNAQANSADSALEMTEFTHSKNFHVSPFNPLDMLYQWHVGKPGEQMQLSITNWRQQQKIFSAWFKLERQPLTAPALKQLLIRTPWPCVQVVFRIYWHALKLLIKGLPVYGHKKPEDPAL